MRVIQTLAVLLSVLRLSMLCSGAQVAHGSQQQAERILKEAGVPGGLIACVGCDDPDLLVDLRASDACRVHALDTDAAKVSGARRHILSKGAYGKVSVDGWDGRRLPYADNLVNLLVVRAGTRVSQTEVERVLAPGGVALVGGAGASGGDWTKIVKPWPPDIDEWTHWLHGADGNAVADDRVVGPPRHFQWIEEPLTLKHHDATISFNAMVSAKGRVFYFMEETPPGVFSLPDKWALLARDAFNGTLLWRRELSEWGWKAWTETGKDSRSRYDQPTDLHRKLIAVGDCVYAPLGDAAPVSRLDGATGSLLGTYPGTERVSEVLHHDGKLVVSVHRPPGDPAGKLLDKSILVFDAESAALLWKKEGLKGVAGKTNELKKYTNLYLTAGADKLFCVDAESAVALDLATGEVLWRVPRPPREATLCTTGQLYMPDLCTLVVGGDVVLFGQTMACERIPWNDPVPATLLALDVSTGERRWQTECGNWGCGSPVDIFVIDGVVWVHAPAGYALLGVDLATGQVKRKLDTSEAMDGAHHHRCYRNKATSNYVLTGRRGVELLDLDDGENLLHHWVRGACRYGILPCNGLLYAPPDPCMCYATAKVNGFVALAARREDNAVPSSERLQRGPAFGKSRGAETPAGWPTYRYDASRSGASPAPVDTTLENAWQAEVGGKLSAVTVADGKVFVACVDTHTVYALEETSGARVWQSTVGGPVDSPPTFHQGTLLFGSADGHVYCLRASDGELVWRFRAAPEEVRISAFGHVASPWPVHGAVLIHDGVAYVTAGRSSFLDGGIHLYALEPATGKVLQSATIFSPDPATGKGVFDSRLRYDMPPDRPGALSDVLVRYGSHIYMRHKKIDPKNIALDFDRNMSEDQQRAFFEEKETGKVLDYGSQLVSTAGLLDGSWFNQTFWSFENASHGRLLVFDDQTTFGLRAYGGLPHRHVRSKFVVGTSKYTVFADNRKAKKRRWSIAIPVRVRAMAAAGDAVFFAGMPDRVSFADPWAAYEGRSGGLLWAVSKTDGEKLAEYPIESPPVWDGMAVANGRLFIATTAGQVSCWKSTQAD